MPLAILAAAALVRFPDQNALLLALGVMICAEVTDVLDGWVARSTNTVSELGKILDPLADSLYRLSIFAAFLVNGWISIWLFLPFLFRDIIVSYLRTFAQQRGLTLAARFSGKVKAVAQAVSQWVVVLSMLWFPALGPYLGFAIGAAAAVTVYSLFDYAWSIPNLLQRSDPRD